MLPGRQSRELCIPGIHNTKQKMASTFTLESKLKLPSGYEIPLLGYGVSALGHMDTTEHIADQTRHF